MNTQNQYTDGVIVVIATHGNRTDLLINRALRSVYLQKNINPHHIYIIVDNLIEGNPECSQKFVNIRCKMKKLRTEMLKPRYQARPKSQIGMKFDNFFHTTVMPNKRTQGYSGTGAWNTAALHALQYSNRKYFLAILDDDDEWSKDHLTTCHSIATSEKFDSKNRCIAVVSGIDRIEANNKVINMTATKANFTQEHFFVGNPGFQGSNIFIELKTFWSIGGFDESLKSCTDRDLAIRLLNYTNFRPSNWIEFTNKRTIKHYASANTRVTASNDAKKDGLDAFYRKYWHRFKPEPQEQSLQRAKELFDYEPPPVAKREVGISAVSTVTSNSDITPFNLCIGAISGNQKNLVELLKSFMKLYRRDKHWLLNYTFFVLDNSNSEYEIKPIVDYFKREKGLNIKLLDTKKKKPESIAYNRTLLQQHIWKSASLKYENDFVAWIIDDDSLFYTDLNTGEKVQPNYFQIIAEHRNSGVDGLFGFVSDAPPLPFLSTLRTQLLDFYYNLTNFAQYKPANLKNSKHTLNNWQSYNEEGEEFYYDLSERKFQHLERPQYWHTKNLQIHKAFKQFLTETQELAKGVNVFRKITYKPTEIGELNGESIYRGGNTIIYTPNLLKTPNYTPADGYNRRSDFNWAIINKEVLGKNLRAIILPLQHNRHLQNSSILTNKDKLQADIKGMLFYRFLRELLQSEQQTNIKNNKKPVVPPQQIIRKINDPKRNKEPIRLYERRAKSLIKKIKVTNYRTLSLCYSIEEILIDKGNWWYDNKYRKELNHLVEQNTSLMRMLKFELGKRKLQGCIEEIERDIKIDSELIDKVRAEIDKLREQHLRSKSNYRVQNFETNKTTTSTYKDQLK